MKIYVVSGGYPSPNRPEFPFVEQLCNEWAIQGHNVTVIVPHSRVKRWIRRLKKVPYKRIPFSNNGTVTVYSPEYMSFGNFGDNGLNQKLFSRALQKVAKTLEKPDFVYGHFWHNGRAAYGIAKKWDVPLVVASGEAEIEQQILYQSDKEFCDYVKAVVCVSTKNKDESIRKGLTVEDKCGIFPNAIDNNLFYQRTKNEIRKQLGFSDKDFIVCFVGGFIPRKGPDRVSDAIQSLGETNIKSIFIGGNRDGSFVDPTCEGILFKGKLPHEKIPLYLNASDVFVLPTLHEGCSNAIVEAMACGLPIISSNLPFNWDILDNENSIMVDPMNIEQIAEAIRKIYYDHDLKISMELASLEKATNLTISNRARNIINFIKDKNHL